jgi:hypothetical protein
MGTSYYASEETRAQLAVAQAAEREESAALRRRFAAKIVMAVTDQIVNQIIRPGPKPEERECYEMAGELRQLAPDLERLVAKIIKVHDEEDCDR